MAIPTYARAALIQAEGGNVRWKDDGTDPTTTEGMLLMEDDSMFYEFDLADIRFIADAATPDATLNVSFYKGRT